VAAGRLVDDGAGGDVHADEITVADVGRDPRALENRHADLEAVPVKRPGEAVGDDAPHAGGLDGLGRDGPARGLAEVLARDDDVAGPDLERELRIARLQDVLDDLFHGAKDPVRLDDPVGRDVVPELPAPASRLHPEISRRNYTRNSFGSATRR